MHDMEKGLIELFSHNWTSETLKDPAKLGRFILENESGLRLQIVCSERERRVSGRGYDTVIRRYTQQYTQAQWEALKHYLSREKKCSEERARELLLTYMEASRTRHVSRTDRAILAATGIALAGVLLVSLLYKVLTSMLHAKDIVARVMNEAPEAFPTTAYIAGFLFFALLMVLRFSRGYKQGKLCKSLWETEDAALEERLAEVAPAMDCTRLSAVSKPLAILLAVGCLGFTWMTLLPADAKMSPEQQLAYYFEDDLSPGRLDKAEKAARRLPQETVVTFLQEQISGDQYKPGDESFCAGLLAIRLQQQGHLTPEQAVPLAEQALGRVDLHRLTNAREKYLPELIGGCSEEYRRSYLRKISNQGTLAPDVLMAIGQGMKALDMESLTDGYSRLKKAGMTAGAFLAGAVGSVNTIDEAEKLLKETPAEYRAAVADAYSQSLKSTDDTLAYLRMLLTLGLTDKELAAIPLSFGWDASALRIDAKPSGKLPEGAYTILPLKRVEDMESCAYKETLLMVRSEDEVRALFPVHDEKNASQQTVTLALEVFAALPPERLPVSAAEADLILLFDQQYQIGGYEVSESLSKLRDIDLVFPKYDCVQRVSVYDARTGACLLELGSQRTPAGKLSDDMMYEIWKADVYRSGYTDAMKKSCHGQSDAMWFSVMQKQVIKAASRNGGDQQ